MENNEGQPKVDFGPIISTEIKSTRKKLGTILREVSKSEYEDQFIEFEIKQEGPVKINSVHVGRKSKNDEFHVILLDCDGKYPIVVGTGGSEIMLDLSGRKDSKTDLTCVKFPGYEGWDLIAIDTGRYNVTIVYARRRVEEEG